MRALRMLAERPLAGLALGLAAGLALAAPSGAAAGQACLWLGMLLFLAGLWPLGRGRAAAACLAWLTAGLLLGFWRPQAMFIRLDDPGFGRLADCGLRGRVLEDLGVDPADGRAGVLLDQVRLAAPGRAAAAFGGRVKLTWDSGAAAPSFLPGDQVSCRAALRAPLPPGNPGEFDYRRHLLARGVRGLAGARFGSGPCLLAPGSAWDAWRQAALAKRTLIRALGACLPDGTGGLAAGVVFGDKRGISKREAEAYGRSGLSYLLAVAGLHLHLALALFMGLARIVTPCRRRQALAALALVAAYALVTGLQVPVLRASALFLLWLLARAFDLEADAWVSLAAGLFLVLFWQPWALAEPGFQLSFGVTASILLFIRPWEQGLRQRLALPRWMAGALAAILAVQLATVPLEAVHFHQFTWPAFISDLLALPLLPGLVSLGLATAVLGAVHPWLALPFSLPLAGLVRLLDAGNAWFSGLPWAAVSTGAPTAAWLLFWLLGCGGLAMAARARRRSIPLGALSAALLSGLCIALAGQGLPHRHPGLTRAWVLDCGQGDAILVEFGDGRTLLVDGGPDRPDAGSWVVQPALRDLGVSRLDAVAMSHADADHIGGLEWVLDQVPVGRVLESGLASADPGGRDGPWGGPLLNRVRRVMRTRRLGCSLLRAGDRAPGFPELEVLWPPRDLDRAAARKDRNNASLVLGVDGWLLLTGDLGGKGERALLASGALGQRTWQVLKLGHHGSKTSSSRRFIAAVSPRLALASAGRANRFGFPHAEVLARLAGRCALLRTDLMGCLRLERDAAGLHWAAFRDPAPAGLWQAPPRPARAAP